MENVCKQKKEIFEKAVKTIRKAGIPTTLLHPPSTRQYTRAHILANVEILKNVKQNGLKTYNVWIVPPIQTIQPCIVKIHHSVLPLAFPKT